MYDNGYLYRRKITIDHTKVSGSADLTDFPYYDAHIDNELKSASNGGYVQSELGFDIRYETTDGTKLDHEIDVYTPASGILKAHVRIPTLSYENDTEIYLYWGNEDVESTEENPAGVWNDNFAAVYHMDDLTTSSVEDSKNSNDGTKGAANKPAVTTGGKIGSGQDFAAAASNYINIGHDSSINLKSSFTITGYLKTDAIPAGGNYQMVICRRPAGADWWEFILRASGLRWETYNGTTTRNSSYYLPEVGQFYHFAVIYDVTNNAQKFYINGSQVGSTLTGMSALTIADAADTLIGVYTSLIVGFWDGILDEIRISNIGLTEDWIVTEYRNFNSPDTFAALGSAVLEVSTDALGTVGVRSAIFNGTVMSKTAIIRGFQYGTAQVAQNEIQESGSFDPGEYSLTVSDLPENGSYYFRAFAVDAEGNKVYGDWSEIFSTTATQMSFTIDGEDRSDDIINQSIVIEDIINDQVNTCNFSLIDMSGSGSPAVGEEVIIKNDEGTTIFGGYIQNISISKKDTGAVRFDISCLDYTYLFDRNLVHKTFEEMTDADIIADIINTYCPGFGITCVNAIEDATVDQMAINYIQPSEVMRKLCELTGNNWYIDYDKDIHYFPLTTSAAPFNISSSNDDYFNLRISKDLSQLKNRIYVRGGTYLSDPTTYATKGDASKKKFVLPDKPHDVSVTVNGTAKTLGIKNIHQSGYDYYLNFEEKYLEQDTGGSTLSATDTLSITYSYEIPILIALEDSTSILENGVKEFAIFDKSIKTTQQARDRASAELTDYAASIIEGSFSTYTPGFRSGQYININLTEYGVNADYIIQKVTSRSIGGGKFVYDVSIASAKTLGIVKFLIQLLEANKNLIELDDNEVVDELYSVADSLLSDSLTDSMTIDSAGPYATWAAGEELTPKTTARWDMFQWWG